MPQFIATLFHHLKDLMLLQSLPIPAVLLVEKRLNIKPNHRGQLGHIFWENTKFLCLHFHFLRNFNKKFSFHAWGMKTGLHHQQPHPWVGGPHCT
jgi:hypothetical protein